MKTFFIARHELTTPPFPFFPDQSIMGAKMEEGDLGKYEKSEVISLWEFIFIHFKPNVQFSTY